MATKRAGGIAQVIVKLCDDLRAESAIHHVDGVVALLLRAYPNAAVTRNAIVVVAQNKRVLIVSIAGPGVATREAAGASTVVVDQEYVVPVRRIRVVDPRRLRGSQKRPFPIASCGISRAYQFEWSLSCRP